MRRLREALAGIGDALWSPEEHAPPGRFTLPIYLGVTVTIAALLMLRRTKEAA